jgi:hypothetical protein
MSWYFLNSQDFKYLKLSHENFYLWQELKNNSLILTVEIKKIYGKSPKFLKTNFFLKQTAKKEKKNFQNIKTLKFGKVLSFLGKI